MNYNPFWNWAGTQLSTWIPTHRMAHLSLLMLFSLFGCLANSATAADPAPWQTVTVPDTWRNLPEGNRVFTWYRCVVKVPESWKGEPIELATEAVDDARQWFWNGESIGTLGQMDPTFRSSLGESKRLTIPAEKVSAGKEVALVVRTCVSSGRSGFNVAAPVLFSKSQAIRLAGNWQKRSGDDLAWAKVDFEKEKDIPTFDKTMDAAEAHRIFAKLSNDDGPLSPSESLARMKTLDDLRVDLVLSEPELCQPLSIKWDGKGRLWAVQFLQYPNPAGLTMVSRDKFLRTVYDRLPAAPPNHFKGEDKITIHEDTDGDGKLDSHKVFVDGLSLVSSFAFDRDGVWVLNPPYLLFYPDKDHNDVPDGDPEVHLEGFGIEDSHSIANNLRWGPDGWLYATQGSTVTGAIRRPGSKDPPIHSLGQLVWRYHPTKRIYEIFAEGGGNAFGVELDAAGRIFSGHNGGNTRGFHYVQGGYYAKGFGKHGALSNPFTFGYFEAMAHHDVPRFSHTYVIYQDTALPEKYRGKLFGVGPLQSHVMYSEVMPDRSSFKTKDLGLALQTTDTWFRPVDIQVGPDGAIYVVDMYEQRIDHASHYQGRIHKSSGRLYRIAAKDALPGKAIAVNKQTTDKMLSDLASPHRTIRQLTQQELAGQPGDALAKLLEEKLATSKDAQAVEFLWARYRRPEPMAESVWITALRHPTAEVREWAVRLLGDQRTVTSTLQTELTDLAGKEKDLHVRSQLPSSSRRFEPQVGLPILKQLILTDDAQDIHVPLLVWWGLEARIDSSRAEVMAIWDDPAVWKTPLAEKTLLSRLMRRLSATDKRQDFLDAATLLTKAPTPAAQGHLMQGFEEAFTGRAISNLPEPLIAAMAKVSFKSPMLLLRQGDPQATREALATIADEAAEAGKRQQLLEVVATRSPPEAQPILLTLVQKSRNDNLRGAALMALQSYAAPEVGKQIVESFPKLPDELRGIAQSVLASRVSWAGLLLDAVESKAVEAGQISSSTVDRIALLPIPEIEARTKKLWARTPPPSAQQLKEEIDRLTQVLAAGAGNPYPGKVHFMATCGKCHTLFDGGGKIGPNLTTYKRDDLRGMLQSIVAPSAEIREGFEQYQVLTDDGRSLSGFIEDQDAQVVTLKGEAGERVTVARAEIETMRAVPRSLMPEGILKNLSEEQIRDLFAYLRSTQPLPQ